MLLVSDLIQSEALTLTACATVLLMLEGPATPLTVAMVCSIVATAQAQRTAESRWPPVQREKLGAYGSSRRGPVP